MSIKSVGKWLGRWRAFFTLVLGGLCLAGCQTQTQEQPFAAVPPSLGVASSASPGATSVTTTASASETTPVFAPATAPVAAQTSGAAVAPVAAGAGNLEAEVLRVGDSLTITFTDTPTLIPAFEGKIREDGTITLTLNQTFKAAGKTPGALEREIRACYVPNYYKYMTVTVSQMESTRWYYVDGEVKVPAREIYNSRITVLQAIASAGGFTDFAKKTKVTLTRVDGRTQIENCVKALNNPSLDLEVYPGDKVHVPRKFW